MHQKSQQTRPTKKKLFTSTPILSVLKNYFHVDLQFSDMNMHTEGRNFKTFLKKTMQLIWTFVTYLIIDHDIDSGYGNCIH